MKHINFFLPGLLLLLSTPLFSQKISDTQKLKMGLSVGESYFTVPRNLTFPKSKYIDANFDKQIDKLRWAPNIDFHSYYINKSFGFGLQYLYFTNSIDPTDVTIDTNLGISATVKLNERNNIHFIAPSLLYTTWLDKSHRFNFVTDLSLGYVLFTGKGDAEGITVTMRGASWGANIDLGCEYFITDNFSLGITTGYFFSIIPKVDMSLGSIYEYGHSFESGEKPILSNIKLNASLAYYFSMN